MDSEEAANSQPPISAYEFININNNYLDDVTVRIVVCVALLLVVYTSNRFLYSVALLPRLLPALLVVHCTAGDRGVGAAGRPNQHQQTSNLA